MAFVIHCNIRSVLKNPDKCPAYYVYGHLGSNEVADCPLDGHLSGGTSLFFIYIYITHIYTLLYTGITRIIFLVSKMNQMGVNYPKY